MTVLAEPQQAGEVADVRVTFVELARPIATHELIDGEAQPTLDLTLEERAILTLIELDHGSTSFCSVFSHQSALRNEDGIGSGRNANESAAPSGPLFCPGGRHL